MENSQYVMVPPAVLLTTYEAVQLAFVSVRSAAGKRGFNATT
jgi:hypothetical protein